MNLPWKRTVSRRKLQQQEMWELIDVLRTHEPLDKEYQAAFEKYERLHAMEIEEKKLSSYKFGRVADILGTFGLAGVVLTHEYWTPVTSSWARNLTHPFSHNDSGLMKF